jgi:hypothetical protein
MREWPSIAPGDGRSDFYGLHSRKHDAEVEFMMRLKQRGHWRMRRFEVPEDNGFVVECVRLLGLTKKLADRVPAGTHRGDGDQARSRASQTMEDISHARWGDAEEKDKS